MQCLLPGRPHELGTTRLGTTLHQRYSTSTSVGVGNTTQGLRFCVVWGSEGRQQSGQGVVMLSALAGPGPAAAPSSPAFPCDWSVILPLAALSCSEK